MEFKGIFLISFFVHSISRYRNRVEFKEKLRKSTVASKLVDIGTEWNLKRISNISPTSASNVDIGTEWNLKSKRASVQLTPAL